MQRAGAFVVALAMSQIRLASVLAAVALMSFQSPEVGWSANGRDVQGTRYLPASDITRDNVSRLEVAWTVPDR